MHYKSSFNALIMPCNVPYNALYNLINNCNYKVIHYNTYQFIVTLCILNLVIIIDNISWITPHIMNNYNAF